ncbi:MAG: YwaF family protein [Clostridia bacterium]|nr:YwaF family protein [Clostridia bacterium]
MKVIGQIIAFLDSDMTEPTLYGWFHLVFLAATVIAAVLLIKRFKSPTEKTVRKILIIFAAVSLVLEIYKQINFTFSYDGTTINADYQWYAFPFQFCSTPMYVGLLAAIIKSKKIHNALCLYLASFSLFAGVCVMAYPVQVFIGTIGINIQTMICHGSMIAIGVWLLCCDYIKFDKRSILPAASVFGVVILIASIMNEIAYFSGLLESENFNMFYISPHCDPSLPVYSLVQEIIPFPLCLIVYFLAFSIASYLILLIPNLKKKTIISKEKQKV